MYLEAYQRLLTAIFHPKPKKPKPKLQECEHHSYEPKCRYCEYLLRKS